MPSRTKLLNAAAPGATGASFRIGQGQPPYVIRVIGGYTNGAGAAGTNGVSIETSPDKNDQMSDAVANWNRAIGTVGGENETEVQTGELVDLHDKANAFIPYYCKFIRAKLGANAVGTATVFIEMAR